MSKVLTPPEDKSIKTLYIGGVKPQISEQDIRYVFYFFINNYLY